MCAGALVLARIKRVCYGAPDPKAGACGSVLNIAQHNQLNHRLEIFQAGLEEECSDLMSRFFQEKRKNS